MEEACESSAQTDLLPLVNRKSALAGWHVALQGAHCSTVLTENNHLVFRIVKSKQYPKEESDRRSSGGSTWKQQPWPLQHLQQLVLGSELAKSEDPFFFFFWVDVEGEQ